jgi:hypothetical protein
VVSLFSSLVLQFKTKQEEGQGHDASHVQEEKDHHGKTSLRNDRSLHALNIFQEAIEGTGLTEQQESEAPEGTNPPHGPKTKMYHPKLFEGDIIATWDLIVENFSVELAEELVEKGIITKSENASDGVTRGTEPTIKLWRNNMVNDMFVIPVYISSAYIASDKSKIKAALTRLANASKVIRFQFINSKYTNGTPFMYFVNTSGCSSYVGRNGDDSYYKVGQEINLEGSQSGGAHCIWSSTIQHETMHALGFQHEQSRPDRDNFVTIKYANIESGHEHNFEKATTVNSLGSPYDFKSIMHYSPDSFSKNGLDTIVPKNGKKIIELDYASPQDILQIRLMYQCASGPRTRAAYFKNPCTKNCKCGLNLSGCKGNNNFCKGSLVCSNNKCVKSSGPSPTPPPPPKTLVKYIPYDSYYAFSGVVFDVQAKSRKIKITNLILSINTQGPVSLKIFTKAGSGVGFEENQGSWTLMKSFTYRGDGTQHPEPFAVGVFKPVVMAPWTKRSFLVTTTSASKEFFRTRGGTNYGNGNYASDANVIIKQGCGVDYPFDYVWCNPGSNSYTVQGGVQYVFATKK